MDEINRQNGLYITLTTANKIDDDDYGHEDFMSNIESKKGED